MNRKTLSFFLLTIVLLLGVLVFYQTGKFGALGYDDPVYLTHQPMVAKGLSLNGIKWAFSTFTGNLYHPLTWLSHQFDVSVFGFENLGAHHLMSVFLHLLSTVLVFSICRLLFTNYILLAGFVAGVFCLHPIHVESVAWLSERKDVLSGLFFHASLLAYVLWAKKSTTQKCGIYWLISLVFFGLAMLSKPAAVVLPAILLLVDYFPLQRCGWSKDWRWESPGIATPLVLHLKEKWAFYLIAFLFTAIGVYAQYMGSHKNFVQPFTHRMSELPSLLFFYLLRIVWPTDLNFSYPRPDTSYFMSVLSEHRIYLVAGIVLLGMIVWLIKEHLSKKRALLFGLCWFLVVLAPVLGFVQVGASFGCDRYTYLALVGPAIALGIGLPQLSNMVPNIFWKVIGACLICLYTYLSFQQTRVWKDNLSLFTNGTTAQPRSAESWTNLGTTYEKSGDYNKAIEFYEKSYQIQPHYVVATNIGIIEKNRGRDSDAREWLELALKQNPNYGPALTNMGVLLLDSPSPGSDTLVSALQYLRNGVEKQHRPDATAIYHYSRGLIRIGDHEKAKQMISLGLSLPNTSQQIREALNSLTTYLR